MTTLGHVSCPTLLFILIAQLFNIQYSWSDLLILIFFSILPDFDFLFYRFVKKKNFDSDFDHHKWFTHWPITYTPLLILLLFFPRLKLFLICYGLYFHLILDTFLAGSGIRWLYPFSKKALNLFAKKTNSYHGEEWFKVYKKTVMWKTEIGALAILIIVLFLAKN